MCAAVDIHLFNSGIGQKFKGILYEWGIGEGKEALKSCSEYDEFA